MELRASLEKQESSSGGSGKAGDGFQLSNVAEIIDFKKMFAESKAHSRAIDMDLRSCDVAQANRHISLLSSYMASSFTARGGDNEAVLVILLVPRIIWKVNILIFLINKFNAMYIENYSTHKCMCKVFFNIHTKL